MWHVACDLHRTLLTPHVQALLLDLLYSPRTPALLAASLLWLASVTFTAFSLNSLNPSPPPHHPPDLTRKQLHPHHALVGVGCLPSGSDRGRSQVARARFTLPNAAPAADGLTCC